jgi:hypothetical protein
LALTGRYDKFSDRLRWRWVERHLRTRSGWTAKVTYMAQKRSPRRISVAGGRLPYAEHAWIDQRKLTDYALNPDKSDKARGFAVKLGLEVADWRYLHDQILEQVLSAPLAKISLHTRTKWPEFTVHVPIEGRDGKRGPVATGWMVDDRHAPWLTTCHVIPGPRR